MLYKGRVNHVNISYLLMGDGDITVLFLHGWGSGKDVFRPTMDALSDRFTVCSLDLPGFGDSAEPHVSWCLDDYVDFVEAFIREMNFKNLVLCGHSFGGRISIKISAREPQYLTKLVLVGSAGIKDKSLRLKSKIYAYKFAKKSLSIPVIGNITKVMAKDFINKAGSEDYRNASPVMKGVLSQVVREDLSKLLPNIKCETLLFWGEKDTACPLWQGRLMEKLIPKAGMVLIKGAGHYSFLENPSIFYSGLRYFLEN